MKKVLFVATVYKFLNFEKSDMEILKQMGFEVHCATNMNGEKWLQDDGCLDSLKVIKHHIDFDRLPFSFKNIKAYKQLCKLINANDFSLIHCHTPIAGAITRIAAISSRKKGTKVIYTSHGFHFHKISSIKYWLVFYPIEYFLALFTDMIITINKEDYALIQNFPVKEKRYIPGVGIESKKINSLKTNVKEIRSYLNIPEKAFVMLIIGELSARKNQAIIIKAMAKLKISDLFLILCGTGKKEKEYRNLISEYGLTKNVLLLGQREHNWVMRLCRSVDIGIIPSLIEGLGLAGLEIMAAGKPVIGSNVQGIKDYVVNEETGLLCNPFKVEDFANAIKRFYDDRLLLNYCSKKAYSMSLDFDIAKTKKLMKENYESIISSNINIRLQK